MNIRKRVSLSFSCGQLICIIPEKLQLLSKESHRITQSSLISPFSFACVLSEQRRRPHHYRQRHLRVSVSPSERWESEDFRLLNSRSPSRTLMRSRIREASTTRLGQTQRQVTVAREGQRTRPSPLCAPRKEEGDNLPRQRAAWRARRSQ